VIPIPRDGDETHTSQTTRCVGAPSDYLGHPSSRIIILQEVTAIQVLAPMMRMLLAPLVFLRFLLHTLVIALSCSIRLLKPRGPRAYPDRGVPNVSCKVHFRETLATASKGMVLETDIVLATGDTSECYSRKPTENAASCTRQFGAVDSESGTVRWSCGIGGGFPNSWQGTRHPLSSSRRRPSPNPDKRATHRTPR
jgi:hypothetical protein